MILAAMLYSPDAGERQVIFEHRDKLRHKAVRRLLGTRVTCGVGGCFAGLRPAMRRVSVPAKPNDSPSTPMISTDRRKQWRGSRHSDRQALKITAASGHH